MVKKIYIKNFTLISELTLNFNKGLNVITGESGSGKSLIFKSINFLLGGRFQKENIKNGQNQCVIEGEFFKKEMMIIRRVFNSNGQSRNFVNDYPVKVDELKRITWSFIDYHGQNDNQRLFSTKTHLEYLDIFSGNKIIRKNIKKKFREIKQLESEYRRLNSEKIILNERIELLTFQVKEIKKFKFSKNTDIELSNKILKYSNIQTLLEGIRKSINLLNENENSIREKLVLVNKQLDELNNIEPEIKKLSDRLSSLILEVDDIVAELDIQMKIDPPDSMELNELNEKLAHLETLKRKYGGSLDTVFIAKNKINQDLKKINFNSNRINSLSNDIEECKKSFYKMADNISNKRQICRKDFENSILNNLDLLGMENSGFNIQISQCSELNEYGKDKCEFMLSSSKKDKLKPLGKVISGGELARLQLAIKMVIGNKDSVNTLILDEIDSGISGRIAEFTGEVLRDLSKNKQIICITHLPQIAGKGTLHFKTKKLDHGSQFEIDIHSLTKSERIQEIASLISGKKITQSGKDRAIEILGLK